MVAQTQPNEIDWETCYQKLSPRVRSLVYQMKIPRWQGEEEEVTGDVVQDSMRKLFEYTRRVATGQKKPVQELEGLLYVIALNCLRDRRRREIKLCPETEYLTAHATDMRPHLSEVATENVYQERLFYLLAQEIARFPTKQRGALLTDLASHMAFEEKPTALQAAFRAVNIYLEEYRYRQPDPQNKLECSRHAALLYQANQRLKALKDQELQTYLEDADSQRATCQTTNSRLKNGKVQERQAHLTDGDEQMVTQQTVFQAESIHSERSAPSVGYLEPERA